MPDENRFAGLGEQEGEPEPTNENEETQESDNATVESNEVDEQSSNEEPEGGPAFGFDATVAKSIYIREETLELLEDTEFEVESALRQEHDIRDVTGREFHDALIHVIAKHVDDVADRIQTVRDEE